MNPSIFENMMILMSGSYPNIKLTPDMVRSYREFTKEIPEAELFAAFKNAMKASPEFPPTAPKIVAMWEATRVKVEMQDSEIEWDKALKHAERYGRTVYPSDPKLELSEAGFYALRQIGGRDGILSTHDEDTHWAKRNFMTAYASYKEIQHERPDLLSAGEEVKLLGEVMAQVKPPAKERAPDADELVGVDVIASTLHAEAAKHVTKPAPVAEKVIDQESPEMINRKAELARQIAELERKS